MSLLLIDLSNTEPLAPSVNLPAGTYKATVDQFNVREKDGSVWLLLSFNVTVDGEAGNFEPGPITLASAAKGVNQMGLAQMASMFDACGVDRAIWKKQLNFGDEQVLQRVQKQMKGKTIHFRWKPEAVSPEGKKIWSRCDFLTPKQFRMDQAASGVKMEQAPQAQTQAQPQQPAQSAPPAQNVQNTAPASSNSDADDWG